MRSSEQSLTYFKRVLCTVMFISILLVILPVYANDEYIEDELISSTTQGVPTEQEMYEHIDKQEYVSTIFQANIDAYMLYPSNSDFANGVETSAKNLLRWSQRQHARGNISEATARYRMILNASGMPEYLVEATKTSQIAADRGEVLTFADDMYAYAQKQQYVSTIFEAYVDGYKLYPYESRFVQGLETSARNLLNWSQRKHKSGHFDEAIPRYDLILSKSDQVDILNDIANTTQRLRETAALRVMPTAQEQYDWAESNSTVSTIFNEHLKGVRAFQGDAQAMKGLEKSTINLLRWSQRQHARGNIQQAKARYSMILKAGEVPEYLVEATKTSQNAADRGEVINFADDMYAYAQKQQYVSTIFEAYVAGYKLYPYESRFTEGLDESANNLYNWARRKHDKGEYETAIIRYELIIKAPGVKNSLKERARADLKNAQDSLVQNILINYTQYKETFDSVLSKQMNRNPQTDLYGGWTSATQGEVAYHLDPTNFVHPEYAEGGATGIKWVEITASSLNVRTGPSTSYASIRQVTSGRVYMYTEIKDGWYKIWVNDRFGWVSGDYVKKVSSGTSTIDSPPKAMHQFLLLSGSCGITASDINAELVGKGIFEGRGQAFLEAGQTYNVNEIYLLAHALLETGNGRSELANGVMVNYVDGVPVEPRIVYNMYGIGARDAAPVRLGSEYAYKQNWFTPEEAIIDGARWIENGYINNSSYKQDTLYKMRWNPVSPGTHQYATDIGWALKQTANMDLVIDIYSRHNIQLQFDIPVYK